jgi:glucose/arabinose dehydrogenase
VRLTFVMLVLATVSQPADPHGAIVKSERQTVRLEVVARGLETPWGLAFLPDGRLLITERPGRLRIVDGGRLLPPVTGVPAVWTVQDGGLFDVEIHPDYARTGWIYLSYAEPGPGDTSMTVIARGKLRGNAWIDQQVIYRAPPTLYTPANMHYGSRFQFDQRGHLFYSIGDRGNISAPQDLSSPLGKIHRVRDDGSIPSDNPFSNRKDAIGSIWSLGHRNPQGLAWNPATGDLWSTEHGPRGGDELNHIVRGGNYGWAVVSHGLEAGIARSEQEGMRSPVVHWTPAVAPSGMAFYEGRRYAGWRNHLFVACMGGQQLRRLEVKDGAVTHQEVVFHQHGRVRDIVTGPDDLFYVALSVPGARLSDTTVGLVARLVPAE